MLYEFAVTPDVFDGGALTPRSDLQVCQVCLRQFLKGLCDNGLLGDLSALNDNEWRSAVSECVAALPQATRGDVQALLRRLDDLHRFVTRPKAATGERVGGPDYWLRAALASDQRRRFHALVTGEAVWRRMRPRAQRCLHLGAVLDGPLWEERHDGATVRLKQTKAGYRSALKPLLRHGRWVCLIDPHLRPDVTRFWNTVRLCSKLLGLGRTGGQAGRVELHYDCRQWSEDSGKVLVGEQLDRWESRLRPLSGASGQRFTVFAWEQTANARVRSMHDRFVLTDQCGVLVAGGLDCHPEREARWTQWSLLSEGDWRKWLDAYPDARSSTELPDGRPLNLAGRRDVPHTP